jgi:NitT/TauT family transport system ATP-binding protein
MTAPPALQREVHARLEGVTRTYAATGNHPPVHALGPIDLELRKGEFFAVVGPSGCGKSTCLEVLAGLQRPTTGTVTFEGKVVSGEVADGIGVVFQEDASFPWLTVADNAAFGLRRSGVAEAEVRRRVDDALAFMGLKDFAHAYPSQLSGGMRQRVCIARTLVLQPRLILLDEPFGALDAQTRLLMGDEVLRLWRSTSATVLLITHALDEAAMLADRVGAMSARPGRFIEIIETGWPRARDSTIVAEPAFGEITGRLWDRLRGESLKALGHAGITTLAAE